MRSLLRVFTLGLALYGMDCSAQTVSGLIDGYDYVDLGLKSGIKWATYNVGAKKSTERGDYFAWGETKPKDNYRTSTYKWCTVEPHNIIFTKYVADNDCGPIDNKKVLDAADDAATANWGSAWRMPTKKEYRELIGGCTWEWTEDYDGSGVAGRVGTSKANGNTIFFPVSGYLDDTSLHEDSGYGYYWTSSLTDLSSMHAYYFILNDYIVDWSEYGGNREYGLIVRPVVSSTNNSVLNISSQSLQVNVENEAIYITNAQPKTNIQVYEINGKIVLSAITDTNGNAEISFSTLKGVYAVTIGNQSTTVILK